MSERPAPLTNMSGGKRYETHGYYTCSKYQLSTELYLNSAIIKFFFFVFTSHLLSGKNLNGPRLTWNTMDSV